MATGLGDKELVKAVRGSRSKRKFAGLLGLSRSVIAQYEHGLVTPSAAVCIKMADLATYPHNVYCWQRAGISRENIEVLLTALRLKDEPHSLEREQVKRDLFDLGIHPDPVGEDPKPATAAKKVKRESRRKK